MVGDLGRDMEHFSEMSRSTVERGAEKADSCRSVLEEIVSGVESIVTLASEISRASEEQNSAMQEISKAMIQLSNHSGQARVISETSSATSSKMQEQSQVLNNAVDNLYTTLKGAA